MSQRSGSGSISTRSTPPAQSVTTTTLTADDLAVDGTTLVIDETNNRVGVGTATPGAAIGVDGDLHFQPTASSTGHITATGSLNVRAQNSIRIGDDGADSVRLGRINTTAAKVHIRSGADTDLVVSANKVGIGTDTPATQLHVSKDTDGEFVALKLTNESDANDTTGKVSLQFDLEDTGGNAVDAAKFLVSKEAAFTATASTQDAKFELQLSENGTLGTKFTVESNGDVTIPGDVGMTDSSAIIDENNAKLLKFCSVGSAVNYLEVENAAGGTAPAISCLGDTNDITMSLKPKGTGGVRIFGSTAAAASILLNEDADNGTNFMKFQAAASIGTSHTYTWPDAIPASDKILQSDSSGNLSWEDELERNDLSLILHMQVFS